MNLGKPKRKWKIYQMKKDEKEQRVSEEMIGWLLECEDYILFYPLNASKPSALCSVEEVESHILKDACKVVLDRIKVEFRSKPYGDIFSMAQPEIIF